MIDETLEVGKVEHFIEDVHANLRLKLHPNPPMVVIWVCLVRRPAVRSVWLYLYTHRKGHREDNQFEIVCVQPMYQVFLMHQVLSQMNSRLPELVYSEDRPLSNQLLMEIPLYGFQPWSVTNHTKGEPIHPPGALGCGLTLLQPTSHSHFHMTAQRIYLAHDGDNPSIPVSEHEILLSYIKK